MVYGALLANNYISGNLFLALGFFIYFVSLC